MKVLCLMLILIWPAAPSMAIECAWPAWHAFKKNMITAEGRVVDRSGLGMVTTSEGQSYAMFFALVANDQVMFGRLLQWTEDKLAAGDLTSRLPAWSWGQTDAGTWGVLDANSASDADLWIAYSLLEAGRLWNQHGYTVLGTLLAQRMVREEVADLPGLGLMLLPGKTGFTSLGGWLLNPSYVPLQLLTRLRMQSGAWEKILHNSIRMLMGSAPEGYAPDWISWHTGKGWQLAESYGDVGSYNAIRVYLWVGMLDDKSAEKALLLGHYSPMADLVTRDGVPPEAVNTYTGKTKGTGPPGFSAALLPFLAGTQAAHAQRSRLTRIPPDSHAYYGQVLSLFGLGWDQHRFRFDEAGQLVTVWTTCLR